MPVTFGLDISHHQDLGLDLARCRREGVEFAFLKATEGSSFVDSEFAANLAEARAAGLLVAAYHYLRSNTPASAQVAHIQRVVPRDVPVIPDVEANSGGIGLVREFVTRLREAGYRVPLLYLPRWYWQQISSPPLAGLPPLWSSRYPDNVVGTLADEWADVPAHYWNGYGGLDVAVLQFTSSTRIAGHQPIDANAYRGTRSELAALLNQEDDDVDAEAREWIKETRDRVMGFLQQRHVVDADGRLTVVAAETPGARPARALDEADGNHLVHLIGESGSVVTDEQIDQLAAAVADRLPAELVDQFDLKLRAAFARAGQPQPEGSTSA